MKTTTRTKYIYFCTPDADIVNIDSKINCWLIDNDKFIDKIISIQMVSDHREGSLNLVQTALITYVPAKGYENAFLDKISKHHFTSPYGDEESYDRSSHSHNTFDNGDDFIRTF